MMIPVVEDTNYFNNLINDLNNKIEDDENDNFYFYTDGEYFKIYFNEICVYDSENNREWDYCNDDYKYTIKEEILKSIIRYTNNLNYILLKIK